MARAGSIIVFLAVALAIIGGLHYYFWARLVRDTALPSPWRQLATAALWILALSMPATMILWRTHTPLGKALAWPAFVWMGMLVILPLVLLGADVIRLIVRAGGIVITGDLVDGSVAELRQAIAPLAQLKARHGVYFVTGNHEYYSGVDQ